MARKPFKIVNDLDLSGNNLVDLKELYRSDYDVASPYMDIMLRAGNDALNGSAFVGGNVAIYSGWGTGPGSISLFIPNAIQPSANTAAVVTSKFGLEILGTTVTTLKTNNQPINLNAGTNTVAITGAATVSLTLGVTGNTTLTGDLAINGGDVTTTSSTTFNLLNSTIATLNAFNASATINLGLTALTANTINIATAASTSGIKAISIGTNGAVGSTTTIILGTETGTTPTVTLRGQGINLGTSTAILTTATVGGAITGNILKIAGTAVGTVNVTTDVTTGIANFFTSLTTGTLNVATGGASQLYLGGVGSSTFLGGASGTTVLNTQAGAALTLFSSPATVGVFAGASDTITFGNAAGTFTNNELVITHPNATTFSAVAATTLTLASATTATTISIGTGATASAVLRTINIGTNAAASSTSTINLGSTLGTPNTYLNGNITIGDAAAKTITLTGTISAGGIKIFDSDSTIYTYSILPGNIAADTTITLPSVTGKYVALTANATGLVGLLDGGTNKALTASAGGIVWTDADSFEILAGTTAGRALISGAGVTPSWSPGTLTLSTSLTVQTGAVTLTGNASNSTLVLPSGSLTLPSSVVAGNIIYGNGAGSLTVLAPQTVNYVLVSGAGAPA